MVDSTQLDPLTGAVELPEVVAVVQPASIIASTINLCQCLMLCVSRVSDGREAAEDLCASAIAQWAIVPCLLVSISEPVPVLNRKACMFRMRNERACGSITSRP